MKQRDDYADVKIAVAASQSGGAMVATAINTTGYGRARFIFTFNKGTGTTGTLSNAKIWRCATSDGTYTSVASAELTAISSGVMSSASPVCVIDMATNATYPWLKVSGSLSSTALDHSAVVELYNGISNPPSSSLQELVTV